jgi:transposase-like protein
MDWETLYCPHRHCRGYGKPFSQGYLVKNGTSRGQPRAWCTACEASVVLSYGTAYYGLEADPAIFETAVRALAEGNALRATARIVQVDKDTVCAWLHRVACHCRTVMLYFWHDLHVSACQLDELWSFIHTKEAHLPGAKLYQKSAEDHERQPVGECQKLKRITSFRVPRASARGYLLRHLWGRLGVDRLCPSLALGPGLRDWQTGSGGG